MSLIFVLDLNLELESRYIQSLREIKSPNLQCSWYFWILLFGSSGGGFEEVRT